ncbi:hypothetical protein BRCON_1927 [Candidatus Sumerlaea chitinivorans]|uniref:Uncharacterized protein n=1 Tax=Sumerlaea chitinivorans TaxID=2250252 RepID=A0A2Z4Y681_SUMC1|nr:hypothetical protein BRCON_1927 [Candidatus Sumerlaea chitinivorans]
MRHKEILHGHQWDYELSAGSCAKARLPYHGSYVWNQPHRL